MYFMGIDPHNRRVNIFHSYKKKKNYAITTMFSLRAYYFMLGVDFLHRGYK